MVTAFAAVIALIFGPSISLKASKRLVVAETRQRWLEALRADAAEVIALAEDINIQRSKTRLRSTLVEPEYDMRRLGQLIAQIRLRLDMQKDEHRALHRAVSTFVTSDPGVLNQADSKPILDALDVLARAIALDVGTPSI